jgi:S1-C subfamily serine protease
MPAEVGVDDGAGPAEVTAAIESLPPPPVEVAPRPAPPVADQPPPRRRRLVATVAVVALVVAASLAGVAAKLSGDISALEDDIAALRADARSTDESIQGIDQRLAAVEGEEEPFDSAAVAELVAPSVFSIVAPLDATSSSLGTGFVLAKRERWSQLVTNYHVIEERWAAGLTDVLVIQAGREYVGEIVKVSPSDDLALVEIPADLAALEPAATAPEPGDSVLVVGSGAGLEGTVTTGVVSAVDRVVDGDTWLQFSAQVNPGNSGGPVVDRAGAVLGVATFKAVAIEVEGLSFAIPIERVCSALRVC